MKYIAIVLTIVFAFGVKDAYTAYAMAVCVTDTECQAADGQEI